MKMGDVLTIRGGKTVEVLNTDAEGRLIMADALVLAAEEHPDAIVNIATLTGACLRALGDQIAGVFGNHQGLVDQVTSAARRTDEPVWQLPLEQRYRRQLDSHIADMKNVGGDHRRGDHRGAVPGGVRGQHAVGAHRHRRHDARRRRRVMAVQGRHGLRHAPPRRPRAELHPARRPGLKKGLRVRIDRAPAAEPKSPSESGAGGSVTARVSSRPPGAHPVRRKPSAIRNGRRE